MSPDARNCQISLGWDLFLLLLPHMCPHREIYRGVNAWSSNGCANTNVTVRVGLSHQTPLSKDACHYLSTPQIFNHCWHARFDAETWSQSESWFCKWRRPVSIATETFLSPLPMQSQQHFHPKFFKLRESWTSYFKLKPNASLLKQNRDKAIPWKQISWISVEGWITGSKLPEIVQEWLASLSLQIIQQQAWKLL